MLWAALAVVAVLAVALSIPSVRAFGGQFLGLFRIQQVAVIPIDPTGLTELNGNTALGKQVGQLLSSSMTVVKEPGDPQVAASPAEASQLAGFNVRLPANQSAAPKLSVQGESAFKFVVDRQRAQALLDESGRQDLVLPNSLDGATISVDIPAGVTASYGTCPDVKPNQPEGEMRGSRGRRYADCVMLAQIPSPTVNTPPDVDLGQLAKIGLEFTGMSEEQAQAFSQSIDWTSSLVIPLPKNAATYKQVQVDGVTGTLIQRPADDAPEFVLVWVKDGIIYTIGGLGSNSAQAIEMANSLQ